MTRRGLFKPNQLFFSRWHKNFVVALSAKKLQNWLIFKIMAGSGLQNVKIEGKIKIFYVFLSLPEIFFIMHLFSNQALQIQCKNAIFHDLTTVNESKNKFVVFLLKSTLRLSKEKSELFFGLFIFSIFVKAEMLFVP